ncbi:hypothetical protein FE153_11570, partial [Streptococcus pneumoniae]|uniref:hypothetical protein n=1 Tax=Streptococcus pneumoniae TaxID=1313 RepID=UPI00127EFA22
IKAFRRALELGGGERADGCRHFPRWKTELRNFPHSSCDLASNTLAYYLKERERCHPCIIFMEGNAGFHEAENSTVHGHVIVLLDGEYIDLTLDQFDEYPDYSGPPGREGEEMRQEEYYGIKAFRRALELGGGERADGCRHFPRWKTELRNF